MGESTIRRFCKDCAQPRPFTKKTPNHVLHLLLSVITVGFWIPVWILLVLLNVFSSYRCTFCGKGKLA